MDKLREWWDGLQPNSKRIAMILGAFIVLFIGAQLIPKNDSQLGSDEKPKRSAGAFVNNNTETDDMIRVNARVEAESREREELKKKFESLQKELSRMKDEREGDKHIGSTAGTDEKLQDQVIQMGKELDDLKRQQAKSNASAPTDGDMFDNGSQKDAGSSFTKDPLDRQKNAFDGTKPLSERDSTKSSVMDEAHKPDKSEIPINRSVQFHIEDPVAGADEPNISQGAKKNPVANSTDRNAVGAAITNPEDALFIPPGAIMSAFLINGVYLPTGETGGKNPHPIQLRVAGDARLPNSGTMNLKDCVVFASGWGELSSERGHFRTVNITCQREGKYLTGNLEAYLSGEDGVEGMSGPIVEKTGQALMRATLAGLGAGMGEALKPQIVQSVQTGPAAGGIQYQPPPTGEVFKIGAYSGASKALEKVGDYYLKRAENIFPVIEISPLREIVIHVESAVVLEPIEMSVALKSPNRR